MFKSVIDSVTGTLSLETAILCTGVSLLLGLVIAISYMLQGEYTRNYVATLVVLPTMVQVVIMLVNGNLGTGVAIVGAFSLVRFRSIPGTAREIGGIFYAMIVGLAAGMGYLSYAAAITLMIGTVMVLLYKLGFGEKRRPEKILKIVIPENLDYTEVFEDILQKYTRTSKLLQVKTTNMGSLFEIIYSIQMKDEKDTKAMLDAIRIRNGNLTVLCSRSITNKEEL